MSPNSKLRPSTPAQATRAAASAPAPPPPPTPPVEAASSPAEPQAVDHEAELAAEAEAVAHVVEDDDTLNLPAASPESILHPKRPRPKREPMIKTVEFKQTLIPVLLTMGVLLPALGGYGLVLGDASPIADQKWVGVAVIAIGGVMLAFAVLTMLQVKYQLDQRAQGEAAGVR
jgi:hypothetical protein